MSRIIRHFWKRVQPSFFSDGEEFQEPESSKHKQVIIVLDWLDLPSHFEPDSWGRGRPKRDRAALACAFVAKSVLNLPTTEALIDRLRVDRVLRRICLFEHAQKIPCKATFSNAFREFSETRLAEKVHEALVKSAFEDKLVCHVSRDSTIIEARIAAPKKPKEKWRRKKGKRRRIIRQATMTLPEMLIDLPSEADGGRKGNRLWLGYKLHLDVTDGDVPVAGILTSASVHDSQVAIPLEATTSRRVTSLYSLMDSAYDAKEIRTFISQKGKVSIINPQKRIPQPYPLDPAQSLRLRERNAVERVNGQLKESFGGRYVRVRGSNKVMTHLMFGLCCIAALQIMKLSIG